MRDMNQKILFSPIGGTDPIKYLRDGSMLHICRHYKPDVVYLYLSHEMMENHRKDNRYVDAVEKLGKHLNHPFEIHVIERDDLIEVQQYDIFYEDFRREIQKIATAMDDSDKLLLNMASGTPAMKSALVVMATLAEYQFQPIQVSTPQKQMNSEHEERNNYDKDLNWELNQDNEPDAANRCQEVKCFNLMRLLKIEMIKKHINAYDYPAALMVAGEIQEEISEDAYRLLQIAAARVKLDSSKISRLMVQQKYDIYPVKAGDKQKIFEYALVLQMKIEKEEYVDFVRGITPIVVDLLESIVKNECGLVIEDYCSRNGNGLLIWDKTKLQQAGLWDTLNNEYRGGFKTGPVYSNHIATLIRCKSRDSDLISKVEEMSHVESEVRNMAAHEIVSVTDEWIRKKVGKSSGEIFTIIKFLMSRAGIPVKNEYWQSYDRMNEMIEGYLL